MPLDCCEKIPSWDKYWKINRNNPKSNP